MGIEYHCKLLVDENISAGMICFRNNKIVVPYSSYWIGDIPPENVSKNLSFLGVAFARDLYLQSGSIAPSIDVFMIDSTISILIREKDNRKFLD